MDREETPLVPGYKIVGVLGQGGMGRVYHAHQLALARPVALKIIAGSVAHADDRMKRFRREMAIHLTLSHPGIVPVYDADITGGRPYIAMELMEGGSLGAQLDLRGPCGIPAGIGILRALVEALAYLHGQGVLHRDLKPANVLMDPRGRPRLTDFGLARHESQTLMTGASTLLGTLPYLPPEVFEGLPMDTTGDVYALGLVGYELFLGRPLFSTSALSSHHALIEAIREGEIPPLGHYLTQDVPAELDEILLGMVARERAVRPLAHEVAGALKNLQDSLGISSSSVDGDVAAERQGWAAEPGNVTEVPTVAQVRVEDRPGRGDRPVPASGPMPGVWPWGLLPLGLMCVALAWMWGSVARGDRTIEASGVTVGASSHGARAGPAGDESRVEVPTDATLVTRMRVLAADAMRLTDRYDASCARKGGTNSTTLLQAGILGDAFHRQTVGDLGLMFTAMGRLLEAVRLGDEANLDDPVWMDVERVAYEVLQEAGSSNGFDSGSVLRAPLSRLAEQIAGGSDRQYRHMFAQSLLPHMAHLEALSTQTRQGRIHAYEQLLSEMQGAPERWRSSPRGKMHVMVIMLRLEELLRVETWIGGGDAQKASASSGRRAMLLKNFRFARENFIRWPDPAEVADPEVENWTRWSLFHVMAGAIDVLPDGSSELADAMRMLERAGEGLRLEGLPPMLLFTTLRAAVDILAVVEKRPAMGFPAGLRERLQRELALHPDLEVSGRVTVRRSHRPPALPAEK